MRKYLTSKRVYLGVLAILASWAIFDFAIQQQNRSRIMPAEAPSGLQGYETVNCWFQKQTDRDLECGYFAPPQGETAGRIDDLALPVVTLKTRVARRQRTAVFAIPGGPGAANTIPARIQYWQTWVEETEWMHAHDLVLMDPRGTLLARPALDCAEADAVNSLADKGVTRAILPLPPADANTVLPILDEYAKFIQ